MVLIVDDKPENIYSLEKLLKLHGFPVDSAASGEEALAKVLKNSYALIILDVQMPVMDGFEVAEAISGYSKARDIPIIFLSAISTEKKYITKGYSSGGVDYVTKPVDQEILLLKVKTFYKLYEQKKDLHDMQTILKAEIEYRKKAEAALKNTVSEFRSTLESLPQIAFTATQKGNLEFVNRHWLEYAASEKEFPVNHPSEKPLEARWKAGIQNCKPFDFETRIKQKDTGVFRFFLLKATPVYEANELTKWVATLTDIEERKQDERKKDEFISIASHELKTPLTSIKAYIQLLERIIHENSGKDVMQKYIERAQKQIEKLNMLVTDLLDISKIESGKLEYHKTTFNFNEMVNHAIDIIQQTNKDYHITKLNELNVEVYGDESRIEQVVLNYLTNAVKYSPVNKNITVELRQESGNIQCRVSDSGIGIPSDKLKKVFEKYYRAEEASNRFQGLGIGLYICSEIIEGHKGYCGVESEEGKGSTFYFTLPVKNEL